MTDDFIYKGYKIYARYNTKSKRFENLSQPIAVSENAHDFMKHADYPELKYISHDLLKRLGVDIRDLIE